MKKFFKFKVYEFLIFFFLGSTIGIISIWPGITSIKGRRCFGEIIQDGSDGSIKISTILSIDPKYLLKIKNARNKYYKVLYIGDYCFRK